jgi:putative hydrolase of the HAD superfamily
MAIKAITIDFWNTLLDSTKGRERNAYRLSVLKQELTELGVEMTDEQYQGALKSSWEYFNNIWKTEQRTPLTIETVMFFWKKMNIPEVEASINRVVDAFANCNLIYQPSLIHGVKDALEKLSRDFKLAIISDTGFSPGSILRQLMEEKGILKYFTAFSFSDETGVSKPHQKAYTTALGYLVAEPAEALHIGDIEDTDILGAKNIGMKAIRFNSEEPDLYSRNNPKESIADYQADSWEEVLDIIYTNNLV